MQTIHRNEIFWHFTLNSLKKSPFAHERGEILHFQSLPDAKHNWFWGIFLYFRNLILFNAKHNWFWGIYAFFVFLQPYIILRQYKEK